MSTNLDRMARLAGAPERYTTRVMLLHAIALDLLADLADGGLIRTLTEPVAGGSYAKQANFRRDLTYSPNIGLPATSARRATDGLLRSLNCAIKCHRSSAGRSRHCDPLSRSQCEPLKLGDPFIEHSIETRNLVRAGASLN